MVNDCFVFDFFLFLCYFFTTYNVYPCTLLCVIINDTTYDYIIDFTSIKINILMHTLICHMFVPMTRVAHIKTFMIVLHGSCND